MSSEQAEALLSELRSSSPGAASVALGAAAQAFKLRPQFLRKQPRTRQAEWMRRALSRHTSASVAEEVLAAYFLESRDDLLVELLDALGVEHEDGQLTGGPPRCPEGDELERAVSAFREGDSGETRELLLRAFAAQSAIDWPELDKLLEVGTR